MTLFAAGGWTSLARKIRPFLPLLVYGAFAGLVAASYFSSFVRIEALIQQEKLHDLGTIADLKVSQIETWRGNYLRAAEAHTQDSVLAAEFGQWLREGAPADGRRQRLRRMLAELQHAEGYKAIALADRQGVVRLSLADDFRLEALDQSLALQAMRERVPVYSDLHRHADGEITLDLIAPLSIAGKDSRIVGTLVLQIDPASYLYPLLRSWPQNSASGESLLVRRDGDEVLFLNELRHRDGTALTLRLPLDSPDLPAAMAIHGLTSAAQSLDYRGIPVVAEMRPVAGTSWFVVSKIDRDELFAPINRLKKLSTSLGLTLIVIVGLLVYFWLRGYQERIRSLKLQQAATMEREMLMMHFEYLSKYANDIIMLADENGNLIEANERAEQAYGYSREALLRMPIHSLCDPANDADSLWRQVAHCDELGESRFETVNRRKDGSLFPVEVSARAIEIVGIKYYQFIIRDITERKQAEDALRRSETLLKKSQQMAHIGSWELDLKQNILYWSEENYRIFEVKPDRTAPTYETFLNAVHPDDRERVNLAYTDSVKSKKPYGLVHRLQFPDMRVKFVQEWCETFYDEDGQALRSVGTTQDITVQQMSLNALRKSAQRIEDLYNNAPCGYHSLDPGGMIVQINDTELQWLGYARDEVVDRINFTDLITPECRQLFRDNYPGFKQRGYVNDLEYELVRKDGTRFFVSLSATAVYDLDGKYLMSRSTLFDISARKQAEDELRLQGTILSQMDEGVILIRAESGTIVYANPKFDQMFGYATGEIIGQHVSNLNAPTTRSPEVEAQSIIAALQDKGIWSGEIHNRKKDGTPFWCRALISTFEHARYGNVWIATHEDITAHKLAEIRLQESEARFRTMTDHAPIMIWIADAKEQLNCHGCNSFNQRWHEFTGLPAEPLENCAWQEIVHEDDRQLCVEAYRDAFRNKQPFDVEYRLRRADGAYRWIHDAGVPRFTADDKFAGFIGSCIDVTEHKLFDEIRMEMEHAGRLQIAGEMASGLAHELSQPVSAANNYLSAGLRFMAEPDWDREKLMKTISLAHAQTGRAGDIINHLKDLVRNRRQERALLDINALVRDTVHFMDYEIRQKSVSVIMDFYALPPAMASRIEVEQVLINLFKNAIESMTEAPQRVLRITTRVIESGFILVSVSDTGPGLAPEELDKVFNPFQSSKKEGLGLGLPICRSLIESHGGQIWAEHHDHEGAEFNFTLPVGANHA